MKSVRKLNGYRVIYKPDHPTCMKSKNWEGYVYEHIYFMETFLGRALDDDEVIHHLDLDRSNNRLNNLLLLTRAMHVKLHAWIDSGAFMCESHEKNGMNSGKSKVEKPRYCVVCNKTLQYKQKNTCSVTCNRLLRVNPNKPTKEQLAEDISNMSWIAIGRKYDVSDNGARKWAKQYGLL